MHNFSTGRGSGEDKEKQSLHGYEKAHVKGLDVWNKVLIS